MKHLIAILLSAIPLHAAIHPEKWYQQGVAKALQGKMEAPVENGRVDVLTGTHAIEVEFAAKWKNALGQSLWYALQTGKVAGIVLVIEDEKRDRGHLIRLGAVIEANKLPIRVWVWPDDFREFEKHTEQLK